MKYLFLTIAAFALVGSWNTIHLLAIAVISFGMAVAIHFDDKKDKASKTDFFN